MILKPSLKAWVFEQVECYLLGHHFFLAFTSSFLSHLVCRSFISLTFFKISQKWKVITYFGQLVKRLTLGLERWLDVLECSLLFHRTQGSVPSTHTADPQLPVTTGLRGPLLSSGLNSHALSTNKTDKSFKCLTRLGVKQDMCASIHGCKMRRVISANVTHALEWLFS